MPGVSRGLGPADIAPPAVRLNEVFAGLSYALDLTEGQRPGHAVRSTLIGMTIADTIGLPDSERESLFHALLLKDLGCSSNAAHFAALFANDDHELKATLATINWSDALESFRFVARSVAPGQSWLTRVWKVLGVLARGPEGARVVVRTRCERGADIARLLHLSEDTVQAIRAIDEHWDGKGQPFDLAGEAIPLLGRIVGLAQTFEVFATSAGVDAAFDMAIARRGRWFDPSLVDALRSLRGDRGFSQLLAAGPPLSALGERCALPHEREATPDELDGVAEAFARVIDAKSPWTYRHSHGVADVALRIARRLDVSDDRLRRLRQAALLHDLGKLGVSNLILDKPGKLDEQELTVMRQHPVHTAAILERVSCFAGIAHVAAAHHERIDGAGYDRGLTADELSLEARILCVSDICDALRASRPYREGLPVDRILSIMGRDVGTGLDPACYDALSAVLLDTESDDPRMSPAPAARLDQSLADDYEQAA
jgi:putative nucleotidyltransferase with HDIG domain